MKGIYVHLPFCEKKCNYCAFASFAGQQNHQEYICHLLKEIADTEMSENQIDSVYFGGGTPSLLSCEEIKVVLTALRQKFDFADDCEITIECNPNSFTREKGMCYLQNKINRISFGVQSLDDEQLAFISRLHNSQQALQAIDLAREIGFDNISADLLLGLDVSSEKLAAHIKTLCQHGVKHISSYMLQIEEDTKLWQMVSKNADLLPGEDEAVEQYEVAAQTLKNLGMKRYEVSNFAFDGYKCRHNEKYWTGEDYYGFGLGAHSYVNGVRYANASTFEGYYADEKSLREVLTLKQKQEEHIMLGLRCDSGISKSKLARLGIDITKNRYLPEFLEKGIIFDRGDRLILNEDYYRVSNLIIIKMLDQISP